ncbi:replicase RepA, partial [Corynebacterium tapiri]
QRHGGDGRDSEMPPMRDRQTMARRVRGYVMGSKTASTGSSYTSHRASTAERKALATMGRKGGKKAAERWKNDPNGDYAQAERKKLAEANKRRKASGTDTRGQILMMVSRAYTQTGETPSWREIMNEVGASRATVARHVAALKKSGVYPES